MGQLPAFRPGDLFTLGNLGGPTGCVGTNGGPYDFGAHAFGYFEAARRLIRDINRDPFMLDPLVYPLCFLYRQGIELSIKHLLHEIPRLYKENCPPIPNHRLLENWQQLRTYLVRQQAEYPGEKNVREETLQWVDVVLADFVRVDPDGLVFRYPESKKGDRFLQEKSHVNFTQLESFMGPLGTWFEEMINAIGQMVYDSLPDYEASTCSDPESSETNRVAGLHAGAIQTAPDFDAPLPDDFWTGQS